MKAGVIPDGYKGRFGWHNLRHSLATFFAANEVKLPVIQSILRHAKPSTTALYLHRVNAAQLTAQAKFLEAINITTMMDHLHKSPEFRDTPRFGNPYPQKYPHQELASTIPPWTQKDKSR